MKKIYILFAILCFSIIVWADDFLQGGFVLPDIQSNLSVPANNVFQLRNGKQHISFQTLLGNCHLR